MDDLRTDYELADESVDAFHELGWTRLPGLISPEMAADVLARLRERFGGDRPTFAVGSQEWLANPGFSQILHIQEGFSHDDDYFRDIALSPRLTGTALRLMGAQKARFFNDSAFVKSGRGGVDTPMHQDFPYWPFDRSGSLTIWIALVDMTPDMGTLTFLSGSHRAGCLGRFNYDADDDARVDHPWLEDRYPFVPGHRLSAGDATAHWDLTVHGAGANTTESDRAAYSLRYTPHNAIYTGAPHRLFDGLGVTTDKPIGDALALITLDPAGGPGR